MNILIYCEECTRQERLKDKYAITSFQSLTEATNHIIQYGHVVKVELEPEPTDD